MTAGNAAFICVCHHYVWPRICFLEALFCPRPELHEQHPPPSHLPSSLLPALHSPWNSLLPPHIYYGVCYSHPTRLRPGMARHQGDEHRQARNTPSARPAHGAVARQPSRISEDRSTLKVSILKSPSIIFKSCEPVTNDFFLVDRLTEWARIYGGMYSVRCSHVSGTCLNTNAILRPMSIVEARTWHCNRSH